MKKYVVVTALASLCFITSQAYAASQPPKDTIWEYKGDSGKTLWQVCGSQNSTCKIVGSTKHYVAVLNHKSASDCAFGDFYIVARTDRNWQQRDTGTCSPNAYVQKGTINKEPLIMVSTLRLILASTVRSSNATRLVIGTKKKNYQAKNVHVGKKKTVQKVGCKPTNNK